MNKNNSDIFLRFINNSNIKNDKLNDETLKSTSNDINIINRKIKTYQRKIMKCDSIEDLNKIEINSVSNDLGLIIQNSMLIEEQELKRNVEESNQLYRSLEIEYFNKKIELLNNEINKTAFDSEQNLKEITGGTLFSIASVFLGISLTSSLVAGVQEINENFIILYFMTCLLVAVITIGTATLFMRKFDAKSIVITTIIVVVSILWGIIACLTYDKYNEINGDTHKEITNINQNKKENAGMLQNQEN